MVQSKPSNNVSANTSFLRRVGPAFDNWLMSHTPSWFWKTLMFHQDGLLTPKDPKLMDNIVHALIVLASIALLIGLYFRL